MQSWYNVSQQKNSFSPEELYFVGVCLLIYVGGTWSFFKKQGFEQEYCFSDFKGPKQEDFPVVLSNRGSLTDLM